MAEPPVPGPLTRALRIESGADPPVVALVGGGGKTTAMFALAGELAAAGRRVVMTTTTRLFLSQRDESRTWCTVDDGAALGRALDRYGLCLVTAAEIDPAAGKVQGITPAQVERLAARADVDAVVIEADGSRGRPFKAPAPHEPVIPAITTHVVAMVGANLFGHPLDERTVHRPERVAAIGGVAVGSPLTPALVARVLLHPAGGRQYVPERAHFLPFFNRIDDPASRLQAGAAADRLLADPRPREVILGALHRRAEGGLARRSRGAAIVLAAGIGRRFGATKQLLEWRGSPLVTRAAEVALDAVETVIVVVGHEAEAVARAVEHLPVEVIFNPDYASGQGSSVASGIRTLLSGSRPFIGEAFFLLADQPLIERPLLTALRERRGLAPIAVPRYQGKRGNPTLFDAALFPDLMALEGKAGGRALFDRYADQIAWLDVADDAVLRDVDTRAAWAALRAAADR